MTDLTRSKGAGIPRAAAHGSVMAVVLIALAIAIFLAAGFWQLHRAHYKDALKSAADARLHDAPIALPVTPVNAVDIEFRPVHVRGTWIAGKTIFLDNKIENGVVGYHVVSPLRIDGSQLAVLIDRGWIAAPSQRSVLPDVPTPSGIVNIEGIARIPSKRFLELSNTVEEGRQNRIWQNLTIERFRAWSGFALQPVVVFQQNAGTDGLKRVPVAPEVGGLGPERHRGYALTWFGLAAVTLVLGLFAKFKSRPHG